MYYLCLSLLLITINSTSFSLAEDKVPHAPKPNVRHISANSPFAKDHTLMLMLDTENKHQKNQLPAKTSATQCIINNKQFVYCY